MTRPTPRLALDGGAGLGMVSLADLYLEEYLDKIVLATAALDDDRLWDRPGVGTNSIANLILHLCGNLSLWVLAGLGGESFVRDRAAEFAADRTHSTEELLAGLRDVVSRSRAVIATMDRTALDEVLDVQGYETDGRGVVFHAVEHMSYHTGQIVLIAKQMLSDSGGLEFYPHHRSE